MIRRSRRPKKLPHPLERPTFVMTEELLDQYPQEYDEMFDTESGLDEIAPNVWHASPIRSQNVLAILHVLGATGADAGTIVVVSESETTVCDGARASNGGAGHVAVHHRGKLLVTIGRSTIEDNPEAVNDDTAPLCFVDRRVTGKWCGVVRWGDHDSAEGVARRLAGVAATSFEVGSDRLDVVILDDPNSPVEIT
jgi:hypothetical protein